MRALALIALIALAACLPEEDTGRPGPTTLSNDELAQCEADDGRIGVAGLSGAEICIRPTSDGGRACSRSSDCENYCEAESRTCAPTDYPFGCYSFLDEDGQAITICVD